MLVSLQPKNLEATSDNRKQQTATIQKLLRYKHVYVLMKNFLDFALQSWSKT